MYEPLPSSFYRYPVELDELPGIDWMFLMHRSAYTSRAGYRAAAESAPAAGRRSRASSTRAWNQLEFEHDNDHHDKPVSIRSESARTPR